MDWKISFEKAAVKQFEKLSRGNAGLRSRSTCISESPFSLIQEFSVKLSRDELQGYWRYRVGDYRIICQIRDKELLILVIEVGHRREIYR